MDVVWLFAGMAFFGLCAGLVWLFDNLRAGE